MTDPMVGEQYGKYILVERLNKGGEAEIWKAKDITSGYEVVLRLPYRNRKYSIDTGDLQRHFEREVQIYESLKGCPYIISLLESDWNAGKPYLVMPYIQGGSLKNKLKILGNKPLPFKQSLTYIKQTAEALSYVHKAGFMHRDACPKNLLLGSDGILLSDFGLAANETDTSSETRPNWGTPPYVAPEQVGTDPRPCQASDQHALAVILCELLTGKYPWDGENKPGGKEGGGAKDLETTFPKIAEVFMRASDRNPNNRYPSMEAFEHALDEAALLHLLEQPTLIGNGSTENEESNLEKRDPETHQPPSQEPPDHSDHSQESHSPDQQNGNRQAPRQTPHPAFSWRKAIRQFLTHLLVAILTIIIGGGISWYLLTNASATPNSLIVTTLSDNGAGSLRQEITTAKKENITTIAFASSLQGTVELTQDLEIPANMNIEAPKAHHITITPQKLTVTLHIPQGKTVSFTNIDFQGTNEERTNAFIVNEGTLRISNSRMSNFQTRSDGALNNLGGTLTLSQCEIDSNRTSGNEGGAFSNYNGTVTLDNCNVHDNQANYNGGGIYSLNGHVFIQNHSSINHNQVLQPLSGGDLGGGGGMTIHGGSISISASSIEDNTSQGDGGGILLIGTSALIDDSSIQYNRTSTDQAGGIAAVSNPENNYSSFLILADNTLVQYNSNLNATSSTDFVVNIEGKVVSQDAADTSINSEPTQSSVDPTTFPQFLGILKKSDFQTYCQTQKNSQNQPFTDASISSDGQTITCTSSNNGGTLLLSTQNGQVNQVCAMVYPNAKLPLARLFRYPDPTTWQCFQDEQFLSYITKPVPSTNQVPLDSYCAGEGATATLTREPNQPANAYEWSCKQGTNYLSITMDSACQDVTGNPLAIGILRDHSDPKSWECWGPQH